MKIRLRTLLLLTVAASISMAIWQRYDAHLRVWQKKTAQSLSKSAWMQESSCYFCAYNLDGFTYLDEMDSRFVDFRYWSDGAGCEKFWTVWRIPYSGAALNEHIKHFELEKCQLSAEMIAALDANMPADWDFESDLKLAVYQPKRQKGISYFCRLLLYDSENRILYFYDMDQEIPA